MKKNNIIKSMLYACVLTACVAGLGACSDEEDYDFPGDPYNRVFLVDSKPTYKIVQTPVSTIGSVSFSTTLKSIYKATANIQATVQLDNSLVATYNEAHGTKYEAIPESALTLRNATLTIPAGSTVTQDTLHLSLTDDANVLKTLDNENGYLIPLRLVSAEGGDAQPSTDVNTAYLKVTVTEDNVNHDATKNDIKGTLVADQTGWTVTTNGNVQSWYEPIETLLDGDASSYCSIRGNGDELHLIIDMKKEYTFDAITLYYSSYWGESGALSDAMQIYTSSDGENWKSSGENTSPSAAYCVFYAPITARYIRLTTSGAGTIMAGVFNIYATK